MSRSRFGYAMLCILGLLVLFQDVGPAPNELLASSSAAIGAEQDEAKVALTEDGMVTEKALTVSMNDQLTKKLRSQIAEAIERYPDATVRLTLRGVTPPAERKLIHGFNVFLNKPDATAATPEDDPHFVRAVEFEPTTDSSPQSFSLDLLRSLVRLNKLEKLDIMDTKKPLKITIVAIPAPGVSRIPLDASFSVRELAVRVPPRRKPQ